MRISFSLVLNLNLTCFLDMHFIKSCNLSLYRLLRPLSFMEIVSLWSCWCVDGVARFYFDLCKMFLTLFSCVLLACLSGQM